MIVGGWSSRGSGLIGKERRVQVTILIQMCTHMHTSQVSTCAWKVVVKIKSSTLSNSSCCSKNCSKSPTSIKQNTHNGLLFVHLYMHVLYKLHALFPTYYWLYRSLFVCQMRISKHSTRDFWHWLKKEDR